MLPLAGAAHSNHISGTGSRAAGRKNAVRADRQDLMSAVTHEAFDPNEIEVLGAVFQNVRAAIGEHLDDPAIHQRVAALVFNFVMRGDLDPARLYIKTFESLQAVPLAF
jgi:hypothetical protein